MTAARGVTESKRRSYLNKRKDKRYLEASEKAFLQAVRRDKARKAAKKRAKAKKGSK